MLFDYKSRCERVQQRWVFAIMGFLCVTISSMLKICLSMAITEMVVKRNSLEYSDETCVYSSDLTNSTTTARDIGVGLYDWDEKLQGIILSSASWGIIVMHIPGGVLAEKVGGKYIMGLGVFVMSILTLLTPFAIQIGESTALIVLRFFLGCADGVIFPAISVLLSHWAPPSDRSKMGCLVFSGLGIGSVFGFMATGSLIHYSSIGWHSVFYVYGSCGVILFLLWSVLCYNNPDEHPFISEKEKKYLQETMSEHKHKKIPPTPWRHILRSAPFWALVLSNVGQDWGCVTLAMDLPKYVSSNLKFSVHVNGLMLGLPSLLMWLLALPISWLADWLINNNKLTRTNVRKLFSTLSSFGPGASLIIVSYVGCDRVLKAAFICLTIILLSAMFSGMKVNSLDLSPNYSGTLLAVAGSFGSLSSMTAPYVIGILAPNQSAEEWRLVFWIFCIIYFVTNLVYIVYASGEVQYWNDPEFLIREQEQRNNITASALPEEFKKSSHTVNVDISTK